jgi:hypothetical protein
MTAVHTAGPAADTADTADPPPRLKDLRRSARFRAIAGSTAVSAVGNGLFAAVSFLYYTHVVQVPATTVGSVLTVVGAASIALGVPVGRALDRIHPARINALLLLLQGLAVAAMAMVDTPMPLYAAVAATTLLSKVKLAARGSLIALAFQDSTRMAARAWLRTLSNMGMAVGSGLAAAATFTGSYRAALLGVGACYGASAIPLLRLDLPAAGPAPASAGRKGGALRDLRYVTVAVLSGVFSIHYYVIEIGVPIWISSGPRRAAWLVSAGLVINTVLVSALQIPLSRFITDVRASVRATVAAGGLIAASCVLLAAAAGLDGGAQLALALTAFAVYSVGEVLQASAAWELSFVLADPRRPSEYQGLFASGTTIGPVLAPMTIALVLSLGDGGWLILAAGFLVVAVAHRLALIERRA